MIPKNITIEGITYVVTAPTGRDYMASLEMQDFEKACYFILQCVEGLDGKPTFQNMEHVQCEPLAVLLELEAVVSSLMQYDIPDPTSAPLERSAGL